MHQKHTTNQLIPLVPVGFPYHVVESATQLDSFVPKAHELISIGIGIFPSVLKRWGRNNDWGGTTKNLEII